MAEIAAAFTDHTSAQIAACIADHDMATDIIPLLNDHSSGAIANALAPHNVADVAAGLSDHTSAQVVACVADHNGADVAAVLTDHPPSDIAAAVGDHAGAAIAALLSAHTSAHVVACIDDHSIATVANGLLDHTAAHVCDAIQDHTAAEIVACIEDHEASDIDDHGSVTTPLTTDPESTGLNFGSNPNTETTVVNAHSATISSETIAAHSGSFTDYALSGVTVDESETGIEEADPGHTHTTSSSPAASGSDFDAAENDEVSEEQIELDDPGHDHAITEPNSGAGHRHGFSTLTHASHSHTISGLTHDAHKHSILASQLNAAIVDPQHDHDLPVLVHSGTLAHVATQEVVGHNPTANNLDHSGVGYVSHYATGATIDHAGVRDTQPRCRCFCRSAFGLGRLGSLGKRGSGHRPRRFGNA